MAAPLSHILNKVDQQDDSQSRTSLPDSHLMDAANALTIMRDGAALMSNGAFDAARSLMALVNEDSQLARRRIEAEERAASHRQAPLIATNLEDGIEIQDRRYSANPDDHMLACYGQKRGAPNEGDSAPSPPAKKRKPIPEEEAAGMAQFRQGTASRRQDIPPVPTFPWTESTSQRRKTTADEDTTPSQPAKRATRSRAPSNKKGKQRAAPATVAPRKETPRETYFQTRHGQATQGKEVITGDKAINDIDPLKLTSPVASYKKSRLGKKHRDAAVTRLAALASDDRAANRLVSAGIESAQLRRTLAVLDDEHLTHYPRRLASPETLARWQQPRPAIDEADVVPLANFTPLPPSPVDEVGLTSSDEFKAMFAQDRDRFDIGTLMEEEIENEATIKKGIDLDTKKMIRQKQAREDKEKAQGKQELKHTEDGIKEKTKQDLKVAEAGKKVEKENRNPEDAKATPPETGRRLRKPSKRQLEMEEEMEQSRRKR